MKMLVFQVTGVVGLALLMLPNLVAAHCDTIGGPVIATAKKALETGDITPVLKWVRKDDEEEIRGLFAKALKVRAEGPEARDMADTYFFETLVRIHRAGEGAPFTGLKPAEAIEPAVEEADNALLTGSADKLVRLITGDVEKGIRERFEHVSEAKKHAEESVEAGREFVSAYVEFTHYAERLHSDATAHGYHQAEIAEAGHQH